MTDYKGRNAIQPRTSYAHEGASGVGMDGKRD